MSHSLPFQIQVKEKVSLEKRNSRPIGEGRISWQTLKNTEPKELRRIVNGYEIFDSLMFKHKTESWLG